MKKIAIHWQIIIGLILGLVYGIFSAALTGVFLQQTVAPIGIIFINLLKLIAMPLVLSSLITGVASLSDLKSLVALAGKLLEYILEQPLCRDNRTSFVNLIKPGDKVPIQSKKFAAYIRGGCFEKSKNGRRC